jgi:hypothetical protein
MPNPLKARSQGQTAISVSLTKELLGRIDIRADALGLSRSRYLAVLAQQDMAKGGPLTIATQDESQPAAPTELTPESLEFLKHAIPALTQYQDSHGQCLPPEVPEAIDETELWEFFLKQRDQILKDKWIDSRNAGYDIGMERALRDWLQKNTLLWAPEEPEPSPSASP